jgi:hypothetical protein
MISGDDVDIMLGESVESSSSPPSRRIEGDAIRPGENGLRDDGGTNRRHLWGMKRPREDDAPPNEPAAVARRGRLGERPSSKEGEIA